VRGVRAFWVVHAAPSVGRTPHVGVALDASRHPLHGGEAHCSVPCMVELQQRPPLYFFSLFNLEKCVICYLYYIWSSFF